MKKLLNEGMRPFRYDSHGEYENLKSRARIANRKYYHISGKEISCKVCGRHIACKHDPDKYKEQGILK